MIRFSSLTGSRVSMLGVAGCLLLASVCQSAAAEVFMDINFNADTTGNPPTTGASSSPVSIPSAIGGYDSDPLPLSDPGYKSPPTASTGTIVVNAAKKSAWDTASSNNEVGALWMDTSYSVTTSVLQLSFSLNVNSAATTSGQTYTLLSDSSTVHPVFGANTFGSGSTLRFNAVPTSATGGVYGIRTAAGIMPFFSYTNGDEHTVELNADYLTGQVNVLVDGVPELTGYTFGAGGETPTVSETFFYLNGNSGDVNSITLDNVGGAVPEPASLSVLGLGVAGLLFRRGRKN